jgi:hypothetical protein
MYLLSSVRFRLAQPLFPPVPVSASISKVLAGARSRRTLVSTPPTTYNGLYCVALFPCRDSSPDSAPDSLDDIMPSPSLDDLQQTLTTQGAAAAIERLCADLRERKDYANLFYALLMKKRHELGVSPVATGSNQDLPPEVHQAFEEGIREAAVAVGNLYLEDHQIPQAWGYFRMLGETSPVHQALDKLRPKEDDDVQPVIDIAFHQGVHPRKGFDWILERYGICSAITTLGGGDLPFAPEVKHYCIKRLVRSLHADLTARLKAEIAHKQGFEPTGKSIPDLLAGRDWLFEDDCYHIDISHLSSVVQMSTQLETCDELKLARELCAYGKKLSPRFQFNADPPFEGQYVDYDAFLSILTGEDVAGGLAHFHKKADEADPETIGSFPAEVLVNLLLRLDRPKEALAVARKHLAKLGDQRLSCPSIVDLCKQSGDYKTLAEVAREQGNAVNFVAGIIAASEKK